MNHLGLSYIIDFIFNFYKDWYEKFTTIIFPNGYWSGNFLGRLQIWWVSSCTGEIKSSDYDESVPVLAKSDHLIIIISDNHQLIKYEDQDGITRFDLKNSDGEIEAEYMSMIVLSIDYPEIHELVKSQEVSSS